MPEQIAPRDAAGVAEALAGLSRGGRRVTIRGGGTKADWFGGDDLPSDVLLSTTRLNAIVAHRPGDLTVKVEAGAALDDVNAELSRHGQWIPIDPPWSDRATIGGIVAANDSGPRRQRYGAPRDLIIGVELARADGVLAKAGGNVVKNVAGYDLSRLVAGSLGSLGVIVNATFKLYPIPPASRTVVVDLDDDRGAKIPVERLTSVLAALTSSQLTPTAVELHAPPARVLVRFESIDASADQQSAAAVDLARRAGSTAAMLDREAEVGAWSDHARLWERPGAIAKVTLMPSDLADVVDCVQRSAEAVDWEMAGRAALGVVFLRVDGPTPAQARIVGALRARFAPGRGSVVLVRADGALGAAAGVWGPMGDAFGLMQAVKRVFDPEGLLNPGRGPGGL